MVIVDFSGVLVASVHSLVRLNGDFDESLYKHYVLNTVVSYKKKFTKKYGNLIFAMDTKPYWRQEVFPLYKFKRKQAVKKQQAKNDHVDWTLAYKVMGDLCDDLHNIFPYKVIRVDRAEADDIVAVLCKESNESVMIISEDMDFLQLQQYPYVEQYAPRKQKMLKESNPHLYLKEHIIRGDSGDGIPNILSATDCFKNGIKQRSVFKKDVQNWLHQDIKDFAETTEMLERYRQNEKWIDLTKVPDDISESILKEYYKSTNGSNKNIQGYLIENRLSELLTDLQYFIEKDIPVNPTLANLI